MAVHVIGLTGGIASGKSTVARMLVERGAAIVDADQLARQVVEPGQPALAELVARFGAQILAPDGTLDRKRLGAIAFSDPAARADLGRITHPRIAQAGQAAIATWEEAGAHVVFYEAALLVENRIHLGLPATIVVSAPADVQVSRLMARDGFTAEDAEKRIAAQAPLADKLAVATWIVENSGDPAALAAEVDKVVSAIEARFGSIRVPHRRVRKNEATGKFSLVKQEVALVTGFPAFTAKRMLSRMLTPPVGTDAPLPDKVFLLARDRFAADAEAFVKTLAHPERVEILVGDVCDMDLGLSSTEYRTLSKAVTWIHHLAGIYFMGVDAATARRVNVTGTQNVLDLARDAAKLERFVHWSTAMVSGDRRGRFSEGELDVGQKFHNEYERTKFEAEKLVRNAMRTIPITVIRPGLIVGDSTTGEIDKFDGPYYLITLIATNASGVRLPLLGRGDTPLSLVPIDYVIDAAWHVARSDFAAGKTFHIVDPSPMSARAVFEAVAEAAHTEKPRGSIPRPLARAVLHMPGISRLGRGPLAFVDVLDHPVTYDHTNTQAVLAGTGVRCPALADYLPALVQFVLDVSRAAPLPTDDTTDPLA